MSESILQKAEALIHGQRAEDYGDAKESFDRIAKLWSAYMGQEFDPRDVAILMILLKTSRLKTTMDHEDSWCDIAGYAALAADKLNK